MLNSQSFISTLTREEKSNLFNSVLFSKWLSDAYVTDAFIENDLDLLALVSIGSKYFYEVCLQILDSPEEILKLKLLLCCRTANIITEVTYNKLLEI